MAQTSSPPEISEKAKDQLVILSRGQKTEKRLSLRAQLILDWLNGLNYQQSSTKNNVSEMVIAKWRKRFKNKGLEGLSDSPRSGKPPEISEAIRKKVVHFACAKPPKREEKRRYTQSDIAKKSSLAKAWFPIFYKMKNLDHIKLNTGVESVLILILKKRCLK